MPVGSGNSGQQSANRAGDGLHSSDPPRGTIVLLDDDLLFRDGLARALRRERYDVIEVEEAAELEAALLDSPVDLIVADSRLADGSDGWLKAKEVAEKDGRAKVLAMTGYDPDAIAALGGFVNVEFVQKSGSGFNILQAIERILARD